MAEEQSHDEMGREMVLTITLSPDGRAYFHDLTLDLLPVAAALAGDVAEIAARQVAAERLEKTCR